MEKYMDLFKDYIGEDRHTYTKTMFKIAATIFRGVTNKRFTYEQAMEIAAKDTGAESATDNYAE